MIMLEGLFNVNKNFGCLSDVVDNLLEVYYFSE